MEKVTSDFHWESVRRVVERGGGVAFTGAGISVESGIPPFRGAGGLWNRYDPKILDIDFFKTHPKEAWEGILELFYLKFRGVKPNFAHRCLAELEKRGKIEGVITQNIDNLHQLAGSKKVVEFHGTASRLQCLRCGEKYSLFWSQEEKIFWFQNSPSDENLPNFSHLTREKFQKEKESRNRQFKLEQLPPKCPQCGGILKPDFVFFGEPIPENSFSQALQWILHASFLLIIGTSGEVFPASQLPFLAKEKGATIIEINPNPSAYTSTITDFFIPLPATEGCKKLSPPTTSPEFDSI
jgi:NAD-dependent deacetylase